MPFGDGKNPPKLPPTPRERIVEQAKDHRLRAWGFLTVAYAAMVLIGYPGAIAPLLIGYLIGSEMTYLATRVR